MILKALLPKRLLLRDDRFRKTSLLPWQRVKPPTLLARTLATATVPSTTTSGPNASRSYSSFSSKLSTTTTKLLLNRILVDAVNKIATTAPSQSMTAYVTPNVGKNLEFGDYQTNIAMLLSKSMGMKPIDVANRIVASIKEKELEEADMSKMIVEGVHISGPGFINFKISTDFMATKLDSMSNDPERVGIARCVDPKRIVIDFSSPNIAKDMHVGHLRSTIIGNCLSNVMEFIGHDVLRLNHVGDWGTQFGMLISYLKRKHPDMITRLLNISKDVRYDQSLVEQLAEHYRASKVLFDSDESFKENCRRQVVQLQSGADLHALEVWKSICCASRQEFQAVYDLLGVHNLEERGESFYQDMLPKLVDKLLKSGHAEVNQGAVIVPLISNNNSSSNSSSSSCNSSNNSGNSNSNSSDNSDPPFIIRKSDGGFLYATTDLAAILHRVECENANQIIYVTDSGQSLHFVALFKAVKSCGLIGPDIALTHVSFGVVQGLDGKRLRTRDGNAIKLRALLTESIVRSEKEMKRRKIDRINNVSNSSSNSNSYSSSGSYNQDLSDHSDIVLTDDELSIAKIIGISSVKYNDLCMNRNSDYQFSFDKMLSLSGNTYCYMLYVYVRIEGIRKKIQQANQTGNDKVDFDEKSTSAIRLLKNEEIMLSRQLIRFDEILIDLSADHMPHKLCEYMFELSSRFNSFYENCPIIGAQESSVKYSRAKLCDATSYVLRLSLKLLGIETAARL